MLVPGGTAGAGVVLATATVMLHAQQCWQSHCCRHGGSSSTTGTILVGPQGGSGGAGVALAAAAVMAVESLLVP